MIYLNMLALAYPFFLMARGADLEQKFSCCVVDMIRVQEDLNSPAFPILGSFQRS
jgi:hypothetical protein